MGIRRYRPADDRQWFLDKGLNPSALDAHRSSIHVLTGNETGAIFVTVADAGPPSIDWIEAPSYRAFYRLCRAAAGLMVSEGHKTGSFQTTNTSLVRHLILNFIHVLRIEPAGTDLETGQPMLWTATFNLRRMITEITVRLDTWPSL